MHPGWLVRAFAVVVTLAISVFLDRAFGISETMGLVIASPAYFIVRWVAMRVWLKRRIAELERVTETLNRPDIHNRL